MMKSLACLILTTLLAITLQARTALSQSETHAIILAYQRIDEPVNQDSNLSYEQFENHINLLLHENYNIIPLSWFVKSIQNNKPLPERSVVITFEGAFKSALQNAIPLLNRYRIPYTVFVPPRTIETDQASHMSWKNIKQLAERDHVTIGLHPDFYEKQTNKSEKELQSSINSAISLYRDKLGKQPEYFAYPYGEINEIYQQLVQKSGLKVALGQQSGPASKESNPYALPRFTITEKYGSIERLQMNLNTLPLHVRNTEPKDNKLLTTKPNIGFSVYNLTPEQIDKMNCFGSGIGKLNKERIGENRVELKLDTPIQEERFRVNCTLSKFTNDNQQKWYWHGMLFNLSEDILYNQPN